MAPFAGAADEITVYVDSEGNETFEIEGLGRGVVLDRTTDCLEFYWYANEGSVFDPHFHSKSSEYLKVHTGELKIWVTGETSRDPIQKYILGPDDELTIPPGRDHFCVYPVGTVVTIKWEPSLDINIVCKED